MAAALRRRRKRGAAGPELPREELEALLARGLTRAEAVDVLRGRRDLNELLQRKAVEDRARFLMEMHGLSRALAFQVALGHAELERVLWRQRFQAYLGEWRDHSAYPGLLRSGEPRLYALLGRRLVLAVLRRLETYAIELELEGGERLSLHKLEVKFHAEPRYRKVLRRLLARGPGPGASAEQLRRPQDRYRVSDRRLYGLLESGERLDIRTVEGDRIQGHLTWFSRFELGVRLKKAELVLMRHALASV